MKRIYNLICHFKTMIRLLSLIFLLTLSTFKSFSTDQHAIVGWDYGNGKVMYCGLGFMMGKSYEASVLKSNSAKKLFVNMVKHVSAETNPKVGIFAVSSNDNYSNICSISIYIIIIKIYFIILL